MSISEAAKPGRIAYLTGEYPAVSHTFILREIEALRRRGVEILTCSIRATTKAHQAGAAEQEAAANTFYVLRTARNPLHFLAAQLAGLRTPGRYMRALRLAWHTRAPGLRAALYQLFYFAEATVLARELSARNVTHLHNHFADSSANVAMLTSTLSDIPFSYTLHGPAELFEPQRWRLNEKTTRARFVACISHFCRSQAMYFSDPEDWHKLRIIHCGVIPALYDHPQSASDETAGAHFLFVGRLTAIKGLRVLMEAFDIARQAVPDLRLTLVGDGDDRAALERQASKFGDAVRFTGYMTQAEVAETLQEADAFVLPSFAEGLPVVLMEALASRVPVIATRVAGVAELVEHGTHGYLVSAGDAEDLAARMIDMARDPDARRAMGLAGRDKVIADFNIDHEASLLYSLLTDMGGTQPRPDPIPDNST